MVKQQIWLPSYFAHGMILQQQVITRGHGRCQPGSSLQIRLDRFPGDGRPVSPLDNQYGTVFEGQATSDPQGLFAFELPPFGASYDPFTLTITAQESQVMVEHILFGEVWLWAGHDSELLQPAGSAPSSDAASGTLPYVRFFIQPANALNPGQSAAANPRLSDATGSQWLTGQAAGPDARLHNPGWQFARELHHDLRCPVAILEASWPESDLQAWIRPDPEATGADLPAGGQQPGRLFDLKIAPLTGLGLRGIVWFNTDADCQQPDRYHDYLLQLARLYRGFFTAPGNRLPAFLMVGIHTCFAGQATFYERAFMNEVLTAVRHQLPPPTALIPIHDISSALAVETAGLSLPAVSLPQTSRQPIAHRLKTVALGLLYQRKAPASAPECTSIELVGNKMMLSFNNTLEGLRLSGEDTRVRGFAICGPDRIYREAQAKILYGVRVLVWHDQIQDPCGVTYGFYDLNQRANLISRDQIPVVPFRSDQEPSRYCLPREWLHCDSLESVYCQANPARPGQHQLVRRPVWRADRGQIEFVLEKANKSEGEGSLLIRYRSDPGSLVCFGPDLLDPAQFPPLDLGDYSAISVDVFNSESQTKYLSLELRTDPPDQDPGRQSGQSAQANQSAQPAPASLPDQSPAGRRRAAMTRRQPVLPVLRWQTIVFTLDDLGIDLDQIRTLSFWLDDRKNRGTLYLDNIRLLVRDAAARPD